MLWVEECDESGVFGEWRRHLLSRWHQLQLKLIWEETQELQLMNWRQAVEVKRSLQGSEAAKTIYQTTLIQKAACTETAAVGSYWVEAWSPQLWNWWSSSWSAPRGGTHRSSSASRLQFRQMANKVKEWESLLQIFIWHIKTGTSGPWRKGKRAEPEAEWGCK